MILKVTVLYDYYKVLVIYPVVQYVLKPNSYLLVCTSLFPTAMLPLPTGNH